jgi:hypothetical protein
MTILVTLDKSQYGVVLLMNAMSYIVNIYECLTLELCGHLIDLCSLWLKHAYLMVIIILGANEQHLDDLTFN